MPFREIIATPRRASKREATIVTTKRERIPRTIPRRRESRPIPPLRREPAVLEETVVVEPEADNVEVELIASGYTPVSKIVVNEDGDLEGKYIKALNRYGQYVYVELDTEGVLAIEGDVITYNKVEEVTEIPLLEEYKCVEGGLCGVVSECKDGICTLKRERGSRFPRQTILITKEKRGDTSKSGVLAGDGVVYPVIQLTQIRAEPERALFAQNEATAQLRIRHNKTLLTDLQNTSDLITQLVEEFNDFDALREELATRVDEELLDLEEDNLSYIEDPPRNEAERNQSIDIVEDLRIKNDVIVDILKCTEMVTGLRDNIRKITLGIQQAKKECLRNTY